MKRNFETYEEAYAVYSDILSGRAPDRKNPTIFYEKENVWKYVVQWEPKH